MSLPKAERNTDLGVDLSTRIRITRESRGLNKLEVEIAAFGKKTGQLTRIENQERGMLLSTYVVLELARALDVDVGWLITGVVPDGKWRPPPGTSSVTRKAPRKKAAAKK